MGKGVASLGIQPMFLAGAHVDASEVVCVEVFGPIFGGEVG